MPTEPVHPALSPRQDPHADPSPRPTLRIDRLGSEGDGVARAVGTPVHVRLALPGEQVEARMLDRGRAVAATVLMASRDRVEPPCPLFGRCGGCVLQHLEPAAALRWKRELVQAALERAGFVLPAGQMEATQSPAFTRRRMDLAIRRGAEGIVVGLHERGSTAVVDMTVCHVLHPVLFALVAAIRPAMERLQGLKRIGSLSVNLLDSGPDLLLVTDGLLAPRDRASLAAFASAQAIPRISWQPNDPREEPEVVCLLTPVAHRFGDASVVPPPGGFLQATMEGETAIVAAVLAGLPVKRSRGARVVELYAGCGTLGLPLSRQVSVTAFEGHGGAAAALRAAGGSHRITTQKRDLSRQPRSRREFAGAAAVVLDPPHAGAPLQMPELAASGVPRIIYVSCNPTALESDGRLMAAAGYALDRVTVIDQFRWSARVESVCVFDRPATRKRGPLPRPPR